MILAAGRGERMRPLTDHQPKPLLKVGHKHLIEYPLQRLKTAGYEAVVINTHYLAQQLHSTLGDGSRYGIPIHYSDESPDVLDTGGGIRNALPLLGSEIFLVVNGDVWCTHPLTAPTMKAETLAHLVLVKNPPHHPNGDFALQGERLSQDGAQKHTFSGIGWYRPEFFDGCAKGTLALAPLLRQAMDRHQVTGKVYDGEWMDIGTPERLRQLSAQLADNDTP